MLRAAYQQHLSGRKSSHLSGTGRSAGEGWRFLRGYDELLVQIETVKGVTYLMLKSEGHQLSLTGAIPHAASWVKKSFTGEGAQASAALHAYANLSSDVAARAAENYAKSYEALLGWLKLSGKMVTIREVMFALFKKAKYPSNTGLLYSHFTNQNNATLGAELSRYVRRGQGSGRGVLHRGRQGLRQDAHRPVGDGRGPGRRRRRDPGPRVPGGDRDARRRRRERAVFHGARRTRRCRSSRSGRPARKARHNGGLDRPPKPARPRPWFSSLLL